MTLWIVRAGDWYFVCFSMFQVSQVTELFYIVLVCDVSTTGKSTNISSLGYKLVWQIFSLFVIQADEYSTTILNILVRFSVHWLHSISTSYVYVITRLQRPLVCPVCPFSYEMFFFSTYERCSKLFKGTGRALVYHAILVLLGFHCNWHGKDSNDIGYFRKWLIFINIISLASPDNSEGKRLNRGPSDLFHWKHFFYCYY